MPSWATRRHRHEAVGEQRRDALGEQRVEDLDMVDADGREGVVVHAHTAAQPAVGVVLLTEAREGAGRADPLEGGVEPERHQDGRVDGWPAGMALDRSDTRVQG